MLEIFVYLFTKIFTNRMKSLNISFQTDSPRIDTKHSSYQPRLLCGGLLPLLVTPSIKQTPTSWHSCPSTPLPIATTHITKKNVNNQTRPQSALFRHQIPQNFLTNENPNFGEDCLLGYHPSISEFGEWMDEPIEMYPEEKPRSKLELGLKGNPVAYSPRNRNKISKIVPKSETEPNIYRLIPGSNKEYQLQEHSLHSIQPVKLLGKQMKRRTMDFVLIGQKKEFKGNEENESGDRILPHKPLQTTGTITKKETKKQQTNKSQKSEIHESSNLDSAELKIEQNPKIKSPQRLNLIIPLPIPLPAVTQSDNKRKILIGRTGIRRFGLSNAVRPNYVSNFDTFKCETNKDNIMKRSISQLSRPHSVIV